MSFLFFWRFFGRVPRALRALGKPALRSNGNASGLRPPALGRAAFFFRTRSRMPHCFTLFALRRVHEAGPPVRGASCWSPPPGGKNCRPPGVPLPLGPARGKQPNRLIMINVHAWPNNSVPLAPEFAMT